MKSEIIIRPASGFRPAFSFLSASAIPIELFTKCGIKAVVIDVDNTISQWELRTVPEKIMEWIDSLKSAGFGLAHLSNGTARKLAAITEQTGIPVIPGKKPFLSSFERCREHFGCEHSEIAMVGDQCVTDIWPANRLGWLSILVEPVSPKDFLGTHFYRGLERVFGMRNPLNGAPHSNPG